MPCSRMNPIDIVRRYAINDHVEDVHLPACLPQPPREVDVIERHVLDVTVKRRRRSDEGKHLTPIVADFAGCREDPVTQASVCAWRLAISCRASALVRWTRASATVFSEQTLRRRAFTHEARKSAGCCAAGQTTQGDGLLYGIFDAMLIKGTDHDIDHAQLLSDQSQILIVEDLGVVEIRSVHVLAPVHKKQPWPPSEARARSEKM